MSFKRFSWFTAAAPGIVIYRDNIHVGIVLLDRLHHTLSADMVGQTTERLGADDVFDSPFRKAPAFRL